MTTRVKKNSRKAKADFALKLAVLGTLRAPKGGLSHKQIAALCGCSHNTIWLIEKKAFRKLRFLLNRKPPVGFRRRHVIHTYKGLLAEALPHLMVRLM